MRCDRCGVDVACKTNVCPLCHRPLVCDGETAFPVPESKRIFLNKFSLAFKIAATAASIVCLALNFALTPEILWSFPVIMCFVYVYYFVCVTILAKKGFHKRILGQTLVLTLIFAAVKLAIPLNHWIYIAWLPAVYVASDALMLIFIFKNRAEASKYVATLLLLCILGVIPLICAYAFDLSEKIPSIVATALSALIFVVAAIAYRKVIRDELIKIFNL